MVFCRIVNSVFGNLRFIVKNFLSRLTRFMWRKLEPKVMSVEEKRQISGMSRSDITHSVDVG